MAINGDESNTTLIHLTASRLRTISETKLSSQLAEKAILAILDYLGAISSGLKAPWASQAVNYARAQQGLQEAYAWGLREDANVKTAAYLNALLAHR
jgi:2-methylcitrate dehydratase PrpD